MGMVALGIGMCMGLAALGIGLGQGLALSRGWKACQGSRK